MTAPKPVRPRKRTTAKRAEAIAEHARQIKARPSDAAHVLKHAFLISGEARRLINHST